MDVSVRAPQRTGRTTPVLRVVDTSQLLLHEEVDAARVSRLSHALRREGVLRNPPIAAGLADGRAMVLDGANRVTALAALGVRHAVVQVVDYGDPGVTLGTWRHYVREPGARPGAALRDRAAALPGSWVGVRAEHGDGDAHLEAGRAAAVIVTRNASILIGGGALPEIAARLRQLVALYRDRAEFYRVETGDFAALEAEYGPGSLVVFPRFSKDTVMRLALGADFLPAGITRHGIQGRVLRLNTPLAWLSEAGAAAAKQPELDAMVQRRYLDHGVRYYSESTFLFDE